MDICRDVKFDNTSELSNTPNISLDMDDRGQLQESPAGQPTSDNQEREEEKDPERDENDGGQLRTPGRPAGSRNKIYEGVQRDLRDCSKLKTPQKYDEHCFLITTTPRNYTEAIESEDPGSWITAMEEEYESLRRNKTWEMTTLPQGRTPIQSKWVFSIKERPNCAPKYKARLVAKGFGQKAGIDYEETFAPVMKMDSIRIILSLATWHKLKMVHLDVKTAFLYGELEEELYLKQPEGFDDNTDRVCKLKKGLYGLKQASRTWNKKLNKFLVELGLKRITSDQCVYFMKTDTIMVILGIYVDDELLCSNYESTMNEILEYIEEHFEITVEEANCFVELQIERDTVNNTMKIHQKHYVENLLESSRCKTVKNGLHRWTSTRN